MKVHQRVGVWAMVVSLTLSGLAYGAELSKTASEAGPWSQPLLLGAHRGGGDEWPENTVLAFSEAAKAFPSILLEGDLQLTQDGEVIVLHDSTVDRTTNGKGPVNGFTLAALKQLDAGYHFTTDNGATFPYRGKGVTIPTFDEVLAVATSNRILFELKDGEGLVEKVVPIIQKHGAAERLLIASFKPELMAAFRTALPDVATCYDMPGALALLTALRLGNLDTYTPTDKMLSIPKRYAVQFALTAGEIGRVKEKGVLVQVHTLNTPEEIAHYVALGVDSILSDVPSLLAKELAKP